MMQGDSYNLGFTVKNNAGSVVTPDDILDMEITIGHLNKTYRREELTFNEGILYETTQVIGTYLYNGIGGGRFSFSVAVGLMQSVVGLILVLASNTVIKKIDPESAMF